MKTLTAPPRPRIAEAAPVGTSGSKTLSGLTLVQDKDRRKAFAARDKAAYLEKGGLQEPKTPATSEVDEEIRLLFTASDWGSFCIL